MKKSISRVKTTEPEMGKQEEEIIRNKKYSGEDFAF